MRKNFRKKAAEDAMNRKEKSEILYALFFVPKNGIAETDLPLVNNPFCIQLPGDPKQSPEYIDAAIRQFEIAHKIESWDAIAIRHEVRKFDLS